MKRSVGLCAVLATVAASLVYAQKSPPAETSVTVAGKNITIKYSAPSVRGRQIFGPGGQLSHDPHYPVWRAGANAATALHTDADLDIDGLHVPAGDYTLFVNVSDPDHWKLIVSKDTKEWGLAYKENMDLGHVDMHMSAPPSEVEVFKITLSKEGDDRGKLEMAWEHHLASVNFTAK